MDTSTAHNTTAGSSTYGTSGQSASSTIQQSADRAARSAHETVDKVTESVSSTAAPLVEWVAKQEKSIAAHPLTSIGLAFGAGYLISHMLSDR